MYCRHCGAVLPENAGFCGACGSVQGRTAQAASPPAGLRGFSPRISDPAFAGYIKKANRWSAIVSAVLAVAAVVGFYIAGEAGAEGMRNPDALYIGVAVGGMSLVIALFQILGRKRSTTWDGTVADKKIKRKTARQSYGDDDVHYEEYLEYSVIIHATGGKST